MALDHAAIDYLPDPSALLSQEPCVLERRLIARCRVV